MANTKVTGDLLADGTLFARHLNESHGITTSVIGEGTNLFYTDTRVGTYLSTYLPANGYDTATNIIASIVDSAPVTLDTLNELAAALGDDPNFATTVTNSLASKLPLTGGTLTGALSVNGIITSNSSNAGDYVRLYAGSGSAQWDIYGNGENLRFSENSSGGGSVVIDSNLGLGVAPSAMSAVSGVELVQGSQISSRILANVPQLYISSNIAGDSYAPTYKVNGYATQYRLQGYDGTHAWYTAPSGTAGNAISFTQAMTLNTSGNLSIGNTNNTYKLDVSGTGRFNGTSASPLLYLTNTTGGTTTDFTISENVGLIINSYEGASARSIDLRVGGTSALLLTSAGAATFSSDVVIQNGKFLQAARTTGGALIDIIGIQGGNDTLQIKGGTSGAVNSINFYDTGGLIGTFYNGRLGIGVTLPAAKLDVAGTTVVSASIDGSDWLSTWNNTVTNGHQMYFGYGNAAGTRYGLYITGGNGSDFDFAVANKFYVNSNGNVGIGTNSPDKVLTIHGPGGGGGNLVKLVNSTGTGSSGPSMVFNGGTIGNNYVVGANIFSEGDFAIYDTSNTNRLITINPSGYVGVGVTSPQAPIHIIAASTDNDALIQEWSYDTDALDRYSLMLKQTVTSGVVRYNFSMVNNSTAYNDVLVLDRGSVGIGTTSPGYKLDVSGNIRINNPSGDELLYFGTDINNYIAYNGTTSYWRAGDHYFEGTTGYKGRWDSSGNFGIGTTSPSDKLQVEGSVKATSLLSTTWVGAQGLRISSAPSVQGVYLGNSGTSSADFATIEMVGGTLGGSEIDFTSPYVDYVGRIGYNNSNNYMWFVTSSNERMRIHSNGDITFCKSTASVDTNGVFIQAGSDGAIYSSVGSPTNTYHVYNTLDDRYDFYVTYNGTIYARNTTIQSLSDQRLKENIQDLTGGLDTILALRPRTFDFKDGSKTNAKGFVAQEVEQVLPECVMEFTAGDPLEDGTRYKTVGQDFMPYVIKAIQELKAENEALKSRIQILEQA